MTKKKIIIITGTPGTGKSNLANYLEKKINFDRLNFHNHYKEVSLGYNQKKKCYDIDLKKFEVLVKERKKKSQYGLLVDTHIAHLLPKKMVDLCIVLTFPNLKKLGKKLERRNYSKNKIKENLEVEIFQVCLNEAKENQHKVIVIDSSKKIDKKELVNKIKQIL